jgi:hypothetical protein
MDFMQRFLADPANVFGTAPGVKRKAAPAAQTPAIQSPDTPLVEVPLPHLRPNDETAGVLGYQPDDADAGIEAIATNDMPLPRLRPDDLLSKLTEKPTLPPDAPKPKVASLAPLPELVKPPPAADSVCGMAIAELGVISTPLVPIEDEGDCGIDTPVNITALEGGDVKLVGGAIVDCHLAERLANWIHDTVKPKVEQEFGKQLTGLRVAASYACRNRDSLPDTKLSEHAHGNAIDISAFRVGDDWVDVEKDWSGEDQTAATFLAETRKSACGPFTTVLGPGSDVYHSNHFHLDMIKRRTAGPSKGLYCH